MPSGEDAVWGEPARPSTRRRRLIAGLTVVAVGTSVVGTAFSPYLLTHFPALLLALSPEPRHVVLCSSVLSGWVIVPLTVLRRVSGLACLFGFGWSYGQGALRWIERHFGRTGRLLRWVERGLRRWGALTVLVLPMPVACVLAGMAGLRLGRVVAAMLVGQLFWVSVTWLFGDWLRFLTAPVLSFLSEHVIEATALCVVVVFAWQARVWLRRRGTTRSAEELPLGSEDESGGG